MTLERAESTLRVIAFDCYVMKTSGSVSGLVDVDTGCSKAVIASAKTVTDHLVAGGPQFIEQFFQRRARLRCDREAGKLKELHPDVLVLERAPSATVHRILQNVLSRVKVIRLDFEKRTGSEPLANSCLRP